MSNYYSMKFVSPEPLYAEIQEGMRSYFDTGAVDNVLFPLWTQRCLKKFDRSAYKIEQTVLEISGYQACLPEGFVGVREAWLCTNVISRPIQSANAYYYQKDCRVSEIDDKCNVCFEDILDCPPSVTSCDPCDQDFVVTHKITGNVMMAFSLGFLLTPGSINCKNFCGPNCANIGVSSPAIFDIRDGKFITDFCEGTVYLTYYCETITEEGEVMIPDDEWVQDYIRKFIRFKIFEQLCDQVTDETYNTIERKKQEAEQRMFEAYVAAETRLKKQTFAQVNEDIVRMKNRYRGRGYNF